MAGPAPWKVPKGKIGTTTRRTPASGLLRREQVWPASTATYDTAVAGRAIFFLVLCLFPTWAAAQELRAFVVTIGPGDLPYERFGHNALLFVDPVTGEAVAYDWGRFDFEQPNFIGRFVRGDMLYSSGKSDGNQLLTDYANRLGRRVVLQELHLTPEQTVKLLASCERGYLPENRDYHYDYFLANCSTKLRDVLDDVLDGQLRAQLAGVPAETTFRREAECHIAPDWLLWLGFHAGLGRPADRPIDAWEQTFLPAELRDWLETVEVTDDEGRSQPLVAQETVLSEGVFAPPAVEPPSRWWQTGLIGLVLGGGMVLLSRLSRPLPAKLAAAGWFLVAGLGGAFLLFVWAFTGHHGGYENQTTLLLSPLGLPLAVLTVTRRGRPVTLRLAAAHLGLCTVGFLLHFIPQLGQENAAVVALALPATLGAVWVAAQSPPQHTSHIAEPAATAN